MATAVLAPSNSTNLNPVADSTQADLKDFLALLKPGVMSLVVFTSLCGALLAPGAIHPYVLTIAIICVALASGAAGAINMWYDRDIDVLMKRTASRPIPAGKIAPNDALTFGVVLASAATLLMTLATNLVAGMLLAVSVLFYVYIYTIWLKRFTPQNIVIGGAAGAFPPMIGWTAVTGGISLESLVLFLIVFLWTPPHFWALAIHQAEEYKRANIPMLPVVKGAAHTYKQIFIYTILMVASSFLPFVIPGFMGKFYGVTAGVLGVIFLIVAAEVWRTQDVKKSFKLFWYSIFYLFILFAAMVIDRYV
jgi:protoheme IX farnesyltransferase